MSAVISEKHCKKYMRLAKHVGEDENPCYSRHIGVVIVNPRQHKPVGTGYNGPPRDVPHCDDAEYLSEIVWPMLTPPEKDRFVNITFIDQTTGENKGPQGCTVEEMEAMNDDQRRDYAVGIHGNCKTCPRKLVGAASGQRLELCSCVHAETNAIVNAGQDLNDCVMFCWCGVPCVECTKLIIQSGIKKIWVINWGADYSSGSRWLFKKAGVEINEHLPAFYLEGPAE